jgi:HD superfamily phosphohydrolase
MILRDPVHGLVSFEAPVERIVPRLIDTVEVQRLRRIRQLGVTSLAFPGAEHTRFAHAVGAAFVMKLLLARLQTFQKDVPSDQMLDDERMRDALAAALLHDVGHGPLSHLFEDAIAGLPHHEAWTARIVLDPSTQVHAILAEYDPDMPRRVAGLVRGQYDVFYLARAVSGTFDVDRCDYLLRDAHSTGVRYGLYDLDWLLRSLRLASVAGGEGPILAIDGAKGLPAIESFILARLFMFQQIYLHKATRAAEWMIRAAIARAATLVREGARLDGVPRAVAVASRGDAVTLADYLELDDGALWSALHAWEQSADGGLADVCRRVRTRTLFKCYELFGEQATEAGRQEALSIVRDIARARGFDSELYVGLDVAEDCPFDTDDEPIVVFAKGMPRKLSDVSFLLGRLRGQSLSRTRLVFAHELREEVTHALGA